jgi:hypothetical protein
MAVVDWVSGGLGVSAWKGIAAHWHQAVRGWQQAPPGVLSIGKLAGPLLLHCTRLVYHACGACPWKMGALH